MSAEIFYTIVLTWSWGHSYLNSVLHAEQLMIAFLSSSHILRPALVYTVMRVITHRTQAVKLVGDVVQAT